MTEAKHIDEIRGDLNTFKKLVNCVDFAVAVLNDYDVTAAKQREMLANESRLSASITAMRDQIDGMKEGVKAARAQADAELEAIKLSFAAKLDLLHKDHNAAVEKAGEEIQQLEKEIANRQAFVAKIESSISDRKVVLFNLNKEIDDVRKKFLDSVQKSVGSIG